MVEIAPGTTVQIVQPGLVVPLGVVKGDKGDPGGSDSSFAAFVNDHASATWAALVAGLATHETLAKFPDLLVRGTITRDANGTATSAPVKWPDGTPGTYTATTVSTAFPGAVDAYTITYGSPVTKTYTQPLITRDATGAATNVPDIIVT